MNEPVPRSRSRRSRGARKRARASRTRSPRSGAVWLRAALALGLLIGASFGVLFLWGFAGAPDDEAPRVAFSAHGDRNAIVDALAQAGIVQRPGLLRAYAAVFAPFSTFPAREHLLSPGLPARELVRFLSERSAKSARVTLAPGLSRFSVGARLELAGICSEEAFAAVAAEPIELEGFGTQPSVEGFLFPDSYDFRLDERPERVVRKLLDVAEQRHRALRERWPLLAEHRTLGLDWPGVVTLASIVEKETGRAEERGRIARVLLNRLSGKSSETGGRLESDPTAVYGCAALGAKAPDSCRGAAGKATPAVLRDAQNPYNTYRIVGLPPGPIGNPGEAALFAVLRPPAGDELYFVADGQGGHVFSRTFAEHRQAILRLAAARASAGP